MSLKLNIKTINFPYLGFVLDVLNESFNGAHFSGF